MKLEYTEGFRNEFAMSDALINKIGKEQITAKKKYKSFALGIVDNVRSVGGTGITSDLYKVDAADYVRGAEVIDAEFDTTKFLGVFSITDEALMKGRGDGSLIDVFKDTLDRMQIGLIHTNNRYIYGSSNGKIGLVASGATNLGTTTDIENAGGSAGYQAGSRAIDLAAKSIWKIKISNSYALVAGMGIMLKTASGAQITTKDGAAAAVNITHVSGKIWQKDNSAVGTEQLIVVLDTPLVYAIPAGVEVYSKQINGATVGKEYTGLEDIVITQNNTLYKINRAFYPMFNCTQKDMNYDAGSGVAKQGLTESILREMSDHLSLITPAGSNINIVASTHKVISNIEKSLYQFKQYMMDTSANGFKLGRPDIQFDNFVLHKDPYARHALDSTGGPHVYMLDTTKIGELVRKDFDWITDGREGILERLEGTEIYEAIMTKYADTYVDAFRCHASFIHLAE